MREYIHFFENSDLRDAYENGSDYIEPYVSYTPVINGYEVQFNENTIPGLTVTKRGDGYLISSNGTLTIMNPEPPIVNSNVFYTIMMPSFEEPAKVTVANNRSNRSSNSRSKEILIIEEDLQLTDESTEFTYDSETFYLVNHGVGDWDIFSDSEHTTFIGTLYKNDIVSAPSSTRTDFVHYNKKYNVKFIDTFQQRGGPCGTTVVGKGYSVRDLILVGEIPYSEVRDYIQNDTLVIIKFYDIGSNGTRYGIYKKSIDTFTNTYPTYTTNMQTYRTVIPSDDYIEFEPNWIFRYNSIYCTFSDYLPTDNSDLPPIDGPIIGPISIDDIK